MKALAAAALAALSTATAVDLAQAKPGAGHPGKARGHERGKAQQAPRSAPQTRRSAPRPQQQQAASPQRSARPAKPKRAAAPARRAPKRTGGGGGGTNAAPAPQRSTGVQPRTTTLNTGCDAHKDARDAGSCQERGRGNSGDIDPYRGPDSATNSPARGNDCDEGGGNNRGTYPRRTNPNNSGDSDVDNDRGRGNNRCGGDLGGASSRGPVDGDEGSESEDVVVVLGTAVSGTADAVAGRSEDVEERYGREQAGKDAERARKDRGGVLGVHDFFVPIDLALPNTGTSLLGLLLSGLLLGALGLGLRSRLAQPS